MDRKIISDPIYGFISIDRPLIWEIIEHPYFQRLRRIMQLGLSHLVYPGALHTRFHHAIGAMHLMQTAITNLRKKNVEITDDEELGALVAILLHDIGHGPFSHALEYSLLDGVSHETVSLIYMGKLNEQFDGKLDTAIAIFSDKYPKKFLHQLVSSQLDVDRLDYLQRDSFYSGVSEGVIGSERIIKMLTVVNDQLVVEEKGIYSIESFIVARRIMYWQVYLHKTVLSAEFMITKIVDRARELLDNGAELHCSDSLKFFLSKKISKSQFDDEALIMFSELDDYDLMAAIKVWCSYEDKILAELCRRLVNRKLLKIKIQNQAFTEPELEGFREKAMELLGVTHDEADFFVIHDTTSNKAYSVDSDQINLLYKTGRLNDIAHASDNLNISALSQPVKKYFVCYPT